MQGGAAPASATWRAAATPAEVRRVLPSPRPPRRPARRRAERRRRACIRARPARPRRCALRTEGLVRPARSAAPSTATWARATDARTIIRQRRPLRRLPRASGVTPALGSPRIPCSHRAPPMTAAEFQAAGLYDPAAPDAPARLELLEWLPPAGATPPRQAQGPAPRGSPPGPPGAPG